VRTRSSSAVMFSTDTEHLVWAVFWKLDVAGYPIVEKKV
jgi:hypothetical protein